MEIQRYNTYVRGRAAVVLIVAYLKVLYVLCEVYVLYGRIVHFGGKGKLKWYIMISHVHGRLIRRRLVA